MVLVWRKLIAFCDWRGCRVIKTVNLPYAAFRADFTCLMLGTNGRHSQDAIVHGTLLELLEHRGLTRIPDTGSTVSSLTDTGPAPRLGFAGFKMEPVAVVAAVGFFISNQHDSGRIFAWRKKIRAIPSYSQQFTGPRDIL